MLGAAEFDDGVLHGAGARHQLAQQRPQDVSNSTKRDLAARLECAA